LDMLETTITVSIYIVFLVILNFLAHALTSTVDGEWLTKPAGIPPPCHYFCESKLSLWSNAADQVHEACRITRSTISRFFEQKQKEVVSQLVGEIYF
jgi:hypothetical protein